jgi:hypothetical protein
MLMLSLTTVPEPITHSSPIVMFPESTTPGLMSVNAPITL